MVKLYVKHNNNIALIDTDCDWQGKKRDVSLTTVGQVIAVCASEPNLGLLGLPSRTPLSLHIPDGMTRSDSRLSNDWFATIDESDTTTLRVGLSLISLGSLGSDDRNPLVIKPRKFY